MNSLTKMRNTVLATAVMTALFVCHGQAAAQERPEFVRPPLVLNTAMIVQDGKMVGPGYKLDPVTVNDGYSNTYTLMTEVGQIQAVSDYQLARQIQEIQALIALDEMSRAGVFGDAMKDGVLAPLRGAKSLVTSPIETTTGAVKGVGRWMGNIGRAVTSDDPYQEGGVSAAVGWAGTKRAFALELGVDPYTEWEPLKKGLTSVSQAAFAGGITVGVAMGAATGGTTAGVVIDVTSLSEDMNAMLLDNPPEGLTKINREKLTEMGISEDLSDAFLRNYNYTPMEKSLLVEALRRMDGAQGREIFVAEAAVAPDREVARFMQQRAEMMANYHTKTKATDIVKINNEAWQVNRDGVLIGVFPIDYLAWTAQALNIARDVEGHEKAKTRELWLEGSAAPEIAKALTDRGWKVKERVALLTGEPLQDQTAAGAGMGATGTTIRVIR